MKKSLIIRLLQTLLVVAIVLVAIVFLGILIPLIVTAVYVLVTGDSFMECLYSMPFHVASVLGISLISLWFVKTIRTIKIMKDL